MKITRFLTGAATILLLAAATAGLAQNPARLAEMGQLNRAKYGYLKMFKAGQTASETDFYYKIGKLYLADNQTDSAALFFKKGIELEQKNPMNYIGLARYYYQINDSVQAKVQLKTASNMIRFNPNYNLGMAELYMQPKPNRPDLARLYIEKALAQKSNNPNAHIIKGDHYLDMDSAGAAANEYKQAIFYDKNNPVPHFKAGIVYVKGRMYQEAINSMQKAIALDSNFIPAYRELGEIYLRFDKYHLARQSYDKYISLVVPDTRDKIRYASILVLDKDFEAASKIIEQLKADNVNDPRVLRIQAYTDYETGHYDTGLAEIRSFFEKVSADEPIPSDYEYYAQLLIKNNLDSLAIPQYLKVIEMDSTRKPLYEQIANIYQKSKDFPNAAKYFELNLVNKTPTQVDYFKIGWLYYLAASNKVSADSTQRDIQISEASRLFAKVSELSPTLYTGYFWQARTQALKDPESTEGLAKPFYEKALSIMEATPDKFKKEMTEALKYLGYYYYLRFEQASITAKKEEIPIYRDSSSRFWDRVILITPGDKQATDALNALKKK